MTASTAWVDRYMRVPFRDAGRAWDGADCLGLYLLVLATERGVALPDHDVSYGRDALAVVGRVEAEIASGAWRLVAAGDGAAVKRQGRAFDAVRMTGHVRLPSGELVRGDVHIGVVVGDGRVLHTEPSTGPHVLALDDPRIAKRVKGIYRPAVLW